jgi:hypothetical protein
LLETIAQMVDKIDQPVTDITEVRFFKLKNADPTELANQFAILFPDDTTSNGSQNPLGFIFGGRGGFGARGGAAASTNPSDRARKMGRVLAVPDPRTSSILVVASKSMMPQIVDLIKELDDTPGKREVVGVYDLLNADPQDVQQSLQDLFNRTSVRMNTSSSSKPMLGTQNPLTQHETQTQPSTTTTFGSTTGGGRGGGTATGL